MSTRGAQLRKGKMSYEICEILRKSKVEMSSYEIMSQLDLIGMETTENSFKVTICKNRNLFNKREATCPCCGRGVIYYTMTDEAKRKLQEVNGLDRPLDISEFTRVGIKVGQHLEGVPSKDKVVRTTHHPQHTLHTNRAKTNYAIDDGVIYDQ